MAYSIELKQHIDQRGCLTVIEKIIPFEIKRVYYIQKVDDSIRGGHRHKKSVQALICVTGSCIISNYDGTIKKDYLLDNSNKCLILETKDWHTMHSFTPDAVLLVLASTFYDKEDYIDTPYEN